MKQVLAGGIAPGDTGRVLENERREPEAGGQREERPLALEAPVPFRSLARTPEAHPARAATRRDDSWSIEQEARRESQRQVDARDANEEAGDRRRNRTDLVGIPACNAPSDAAEVQSASAGPGRGCRMGSSPLRR